MKKDQKNQEVILELTRVGDLIKVSAIDPITLTEVCVFGPATASNEDLKKLAVKKLNYILVKLQK